MSSIPPGAPTSPPSPLSPSNGATGISLSPTFSWRAVNSATKYDLVIAEDTTTGAVKFDSKAGSITGTSHTIPSCGDTGILQWRVTYRWKVRAGNRNGWGPFSTAWTFTTTPPVLWVTPASLSFGDVPVGSQSELIFTVTNTGGCTLIGRATTFGHFSIVSGSQFSVKASKTATVKVGFGPISANSYLGQVKFTSNGGNAVRLVSGTGATTTPCFDGQTCYSTRAEAVSRVPTDVVPGECFVWDDGPSTFPWRVIPGTGCAHWVAHQLGIRRGATCSNGYSMRVSDVISGRTEVQIRDCNVGDIWTNSECKHCGIVRRVANDTVLVEHCSSREGGVVQSWFSLGRCWR